MKKIDAHGFAGLKLHPLFNAYTADDAVVNPLMEAAREKNLPVFIHSGHPPFSLPWSIGQLSGQITGSRGSHELLPATPGVAFLNLL